MHALFVTYKVSVARENLKESYEQLAHSLAGGSSPGLVSKTWIYEGSTHGGFCVFRDRESADRYLSEVIDPAISGSPVFSELHVERLEVDQELSAVTHGIVAATAAA